MPRESLLPGSPFARPSSNFLYWSALDEFENVPNGFGRCIGPFPLTVLRDAGSERIVYWWGHCKFSMKLSMMTGDSGVLTEHPSRKTNEVVTTGLIGRDTEDDQCRKDEQGRLM